MGQITKTVRDYLAEAEMLSQGSWRQYRFTAPQHSKPEIPDAVLDSQDLVNLQRLAGIQTIGVGRLAENEGSNISKTANEKAQLMKKHNIKPGTPEWFQLWFSLPYLTGEKPVGK